MADRFIVALQQFIGTTVETIAKRANQNDDRYLDDVEFGIFKKDIEAMGMSFENLGLEVERQQVTSKKGLCESYKSVFGKKGAEVAERADEEARLVISTASNTFKSTYGFEYIPNNVLALRPRFTDCKDANEYENKMIVWRGKMENAYKDFGNMSLKDYVQDLHQSLSLSTSFLAENQRYMAENLMNALNDKTANILSAVKDGEQTIIKILDKKTNAVMNLVRKSTGEIINVTKDGFNRTMEYVGEVGIAVNNNTSTEALITRQNDNNNTAEIKNHVKEEHRQTEEITTLVTDINSLFINVWTSSWSGKAKVTQLCEEITASKLKHNVKVMLLKSLKEIVINRNKDKLNQFEKDFNNLTKPISLLEKEPKEYPKSARPTLGSSIPAPPYMDIPVQDSQEQRPVENPVGQKPTEVKNREKQTESVNENTEEKNTSDEKLNNYKLKGPFAYLQEEYDKAPIEIKRQVVEALKYRDVTPEKIKHILREEVNMEPNVIQNSSEEETVNILKKRKRGKQKIKIDN